MDPKAVKLDLVLILDCGSQYTHLITRRIRSLSVFYLTISGTSPLKAITTSTPASPSSPWAPLRPHRRLPQFPARVRGVGRGPPRLLPRNLLRAAVDCARLGRVVTVGEKQEYGKMEIVVESNSGIFGSKRVGDRQVVWMSHEIRSPSYPRGSRRWRRASKEWSLPSKSPKGGSMGWSTTLRF